MNKLELLVPAGNFEKLEYAIAYGADAVYLGGDQFGLRAMAGNFSESEMRDAVQYAHDHHVKVYVTLNIFPHNEHLHGLPEYVLFLQEVGVDGFIISDPGVFTIVKQVAPKIDLHISTQANTLNWAAAEFWRKQGASRIILARELSISEIAAISQKTSIELEAFVHGAMCISYSGRCYMSHYMTGRDANLGACTQPCRWSYGIVEETRPGEYFPVETDQNGTYVMNSKDLCMIDHIPALIEAGLSSLKIEGRMKSVHYVATVTKVYREAIDQYMEDPQQYMTKEHWFAELCKASNRDFTTGFYLGSPDDLHSGINYEGYTRPYDFVGVVLDYDSATHRALIEQRNHISIDEIFEVLTPKGIPFPIKFMDMQDLDGNEIRTAPHPKMRFTVHSERELHKYDILRRRK